MLGILQELPGLRRITYALEKFTVLHKINPELSTKLYSLFYIYIHEHMTNLSKEILAYIALGWPFNRKVSGAELHVRTTLCKQSEASVIERKS